MFTNSFIKKRQEHKLLLEIHKKKKPCQIYSTTQNSLRLTKNIHFIFKFTIFLWIVFMKNKKKNTKQKENIGSFIIINGVINYVRKEEKIIKCINTNCFTYFQICDSYQTVHIRFNALLNHRRMVDYFQNHLMLQ